MKEAFERLHTKITSTRNARYEAYRRNEMLQFLSTYCLSGLSVVTIALGIYLSVSPNDNLKDVFGFVGAISSLFILIISLVDSSEQYSLKAHLFHKCGNELSPLCNEIERILLFDISVSENNVLLDLYRSIDHKYEVIINSYGLNHSEKDYAMIKWKYPEKFNKPDNIIIQEAAKFFLKLRMYYMYYIMIILIISSSIFLVFRMISFTKNNSPNLDRSLNPSSSNISR